MFKKEETQQGKIERVTSITADGKTGLLLVLKEKEGTYILKSKANINPILLLSKEHDKIEYTYKEHKPLVGKHENKITSFNNISLETRLKSDPIKTFAK